jgi:hypothetical protein
MRTLNPWAIMFSLLLVAHPTGIAIAWWNNSSYVKVLSNTACETVTETSSPGNDYYLRKLDCGCTCIGDVGWWLVVWLPFLSHVRLCCVSGHKLKSDHQIDATHLFKVLQFWRCVRRTIIRKCGRGRWRKARKYTKMVLRTFR